jgi:hypothetical protein
MVEAVYRLVYNIEIILSVCWGGWGMRDNDGGDAPSQGILQAYVEMSQRNPLYS